MPDEASGLWNDSGTLVIDTQRAVFPPRCVFSNAEADLSEATYPLNYDRVSPWLQVVMILTVSRPGKVLANSMEDRRFDRQVTIPVTYAIARGSLFFLIAMTMFVGGILAFLFGLGIGMYTSFAFPPAVYQLVLVFGGIGGVPIAILGGFLLTLANEPALKLTRHEGDLAWTKGASIAYLAGLPRWPGSETSKASVALDFSSIPTAESEPPPNPFPGLPPPPTPNSPRLQ